MSLVFRVVLHFPSVALFLLMGKCIVFIYKVGLLEHT